MEQIKQIHTLQPDLGQTAQNKAAVLIITIKISNEPQYQNTPCKPQYDCTLHGGLEVSDHGGTTTNILNH